MLDLLALVARGDRGGVLGDKSTGDHRATRVMALARNALAYLRRAALREK